MSDKPLPETSNIFCIGAGRDEIIFPLPLPRKMSYDDALILAAYLVSLVGDDERWDAILRRVQAT